MAHLSLTLLGGFEVRLDEEPVTTFEYDKVRALLAFLAVEAAHPHRRDMLAGLLWPERPECNARQNLSQTLFTLRRAIGDRTATPPFLLITPKTLQFNPASDYALDATGFTDLLAACKAHDHDQLEAGAPCMERYQQAITLYRGGFLAGFSLSDSAAFEEWSLLNRERLHRLAVETLRHLVHYFQSRGELEEALEYAWQQVELDPWQEQAHRQVMWLLVLSGQREAALAQYETCRRLLLDELGIEPAAETRRLVEQIQSGTLSRGAGVQGTRGDFFVASVAPPAFLSIVPPHPSPSEPFVAREGELAQLDEFLDLALAGQGRVVFVTGEAGRGKTMLLQAFVCRAQARQPDLIVAGGNGNALTGLGDPYLPFREILGQLTGDVEARLAAGAISRESAIRLWSLLPLTARALLDAGPDLIGTLLSAEPLVERARTFSPQPDGTDWLIRLEAFISQKSIEPELQSQQQSDLFEQYTQVLSGLAGRQPLLLLLDDLQWADLASINLLFHLGRQLEGSPILIVGAYRPDEIMAPQNGKRHPLEPLVNEFKHHFGAVEVDLSQADGWQFVNAFLDTEPNRLDDTFRRTLYRQTGGHPLFTVELLHGMQERGDLIQDQDGRWVEGSTLNWTILPPQVEASIAERIDRLPEDLRESLTIASVEGETFTAEVVARVQAVDERKTVRSLSDQLGRKHRLVAAQEIRQVDGQHISLYRFRHILFQKYLYQQLDPAERIYLHQAVGEALESLYEDQSEQIAVQLARHFQEAKNPEKTIAYLRQAGEKATRLSANQEAIAHFTRGLELLETRPNTPARTQQELALQIALSVPLIAVKGYGAPEVGRVYSRMEELCRQLGEVTLQFRVLFSKANFYGQQGEQYEAHQVARQALSLAEQTDDPVLVMIAHFMMGVSFLFLGKVAPARMHLEQMMVIYDPQQHRNLAFHYGQDIGAPNLSWLCWVLWSLGYPDQALQRNQEALILAQELDHPLTSADSVGIATQTFYHLGQDVEVTQELAEACIRLATEHRFPLWLAVGTFYRGRALVDQGQIEAGLTQMQQGLADYQATGAKLCRSLFLATLAEAYGKTGQVETGLSLLTEAQITANRSGERLYEAEIHRLKGELLLKAKVERRKASPESPEDCFLQAIKIARTQQAKSFELRATMSLSRLWHKQGKREKGRQMLAEVYNWFSEGFDTTDLKEAKVLLEKLGLNFETYTFRS